MTMYTGTEALREFWAELEARMTMGNRLFYIRFENSERTFLTYRINSMKGRVYLNCACWEDQIPIRYLFVFEHDQIVVRTGFKDSSGRELVLIDTGSDNG